MQDGAFQFGSLGAEFIIQADVVAAWLASHSAVVLAIIALPILFSCLAGNPWLTIGLTGLALAFLSLAPVNMGLSLSTIRPFSSLIFAIFAGLTAVSAIAMRNRLRGGYRERRQLRRDVQALEFQLERERLWRTAAGSSAILGEDDLRILQQRVNEMLTPYGPATDEETKAAQRTQAADLPQAAAS